MKPNKKIALLRDRAELLQAARHFFTVRNVLEVDSPILTTYASVDPHIDLISAFYLGTQKRFLHSSPEYGMKRLLAEGIGDIYQLSHVFREGEWGTKHNPEFMMAEWYRIGMTFEAMIEETIEFISLFLGELPYQIMSYRNLLIEYAGIDYVTVKAEELISYLQKEGIALYPAILEEGKDALLNLLLATKVEPQLGHQGYCVLAYYPSSQAALAQKRWHGEEEVAERFEIYYQGIELANGYHELGDSIEQRKRFEEANAIRVALGKETLPLDEFFLNALETGIPDCCGVAVGFDRLMMLRHKESTIANVLPWSWDKA